MSKITKTIIGAVIIIILGIAPIHASGLVIDDMSFGTARWTDVYNTHKNAIVAAINNITTTISNLSNQIANWAVQDNIITMVTAPATYVDSNTFTLPGDYTGRITAGKVVLVHGAIGIDYSTVASSTYAFPTTTVNLNGEILTNPITGVYVVATRDGLWPNGPGWVVAADYGSDQAALEAADTVAAAAGKQLVIGQDYSITTDCTLSASISVMPGAVLTVADTKILTINGFFNAFASQIFSWSGTGKVVFGPGAVKEVYGEWFGALGDDSTDDTAAFHKAMEGLYTLGTSSKYYTGTIALLQKRYRVNL